MERRCMSPQVLGQIWYDAIGALFFIFGQLLPTDEMLKTKLSFKINGKYISHASGMGIGMGILLVVRLF